MIVEFKSKYLSVNNTKDGDVVQLLDEGHWEETKSKFSDTPEQTIVFNVVHDGNKSTFSLYEKYKRPLVESWGNDTAKWVGNKFTILHINDKMEIRSIGEK